MKQQSRLTDVTTPHNDDDDDDDDDDEYMVDDQRVVSTAVSQLDKNVDKLLKFVADNDIEMVRYAAMCLSVSVSVCLSVCLSAWLLSNV